MPNRTYKPLAMSRDSMLAILAVPTRKTMTRRVIVPQPEEMKPLGKHGQQWPYRRGADVKDMPGVPLWEAMRPRYQPGDGVYFGEPLKRTFTRSCEPGPRTYIVYALDLLLVGNRMRQAWPWKNAVLSGRFMPKHLSRACAVVSEVRVERAQDISKDDAIAEGVQLKDFMLCKPVSSLRTGWVAGESRNAYRSPIDAYGAWWDSLNAKPRPKSRNPYTNEPEPCYVGYPWEDVRTERKLANGKKEYIVGNPFAWITGWTDLVVGWQETQELIGKDAP